MHQVDRAESEAIDLGRPRDSCCSRSDERQPDDLVEIEDGNTVWRFEREFLTSNWTCLFGNGCKGILAEDAAELNQGCCSLGAHFGDGDAGQAEAMTVSAYAAMIPPEQFQFHRVATDRCAR